MAIKKGSKVTLQVGRGRVKGTVDSVTGDKASVTLESGKVVSRLVASLTE